MKETASEDGGAPVAQAAFAACLATILELAIEDVPAPEPGEDLAGGWRRWLGGRGLGIVPIEDAAAFAWAGPWIARVRPSAGEEVRAVVMYGVPSGVVWDPTGAAAHEGWEIEDGFMLAALDVALAPPPAPEPPTGIGVIEGIYVALTAGAPTQALQSARALPGRGLDGDRHVLGTGSFPSGVDGSALTLIAAEVVESFAPPLSPDEHRRNLVIRGIDVNALVERDFTIGDLACRGRRLCEPCTTLDRYAERPLLRPLVHRGGLRADILTDGTIAIGDELRVT